MSGDSAHALRIELATALRERDAEREFRGAAEAAFAEQLSRTEAAESALAAANARADAAEAKLAEALPCGSVLIVTGFDEEVYENHEETIGHVISELRKSLAAARRECDLYRHALERIDRIRNDIIGRQTINWSAHIYPLVAALGEAGFQGITYEKAREALAAPASAPGEETKR